MTVPPVPKPPSLPSLPPVKRHHWVVRITHWMTFVLLAGMIMSGLQIYGAYARFGERGGPYYVNAFENHAFPTWSRLGGWLAGGLNWHFALVALCICPISPSAVNGGRCCSGRAISGAPSRCRSTTCGCARIIRRRGS